MSVFATTLLYICTGSLLAGLFAGRAKRMKDRDVIITVFFWPALLVAITCFVCYELGKWLGKKR